MTSYVIINDKTQKVFSMRYLPSGWVIDKDLLITWGVYSKNRGDHLVWPEKGETAKDVVMRYYGYKNLSPKSDPKPVKGAYRFMTLSNYHRWLSETRADRKI